MSYDEDPPTRRLPVPPRGEPLPRERVGPPEPGPPGGGSQGGGISEVQLYDLEQRLKSMRTWLTTLALVAVLALVVAAVALATGGGDDESSSADARTPAALRRDVAQLEERLDDRVTKGQLASVKDDIAELRTSVSEASSAASDSGDTTTTTGGPDVSALQTSLSDLSARVEALEQAPSSDGTATEGATP